MQEQQIQQILSDLAAGRCVSLIGLSNTGKSTIMRALAARQTEYKKRAGRAGVLIYVDCNRAVATSPQAFYEVVLRATLEKLPEDQKLREHYQEVTEAESGFAASLSFNLALTELCESLGKDICLLLDEFDELYTALDDRALLNLRALRDRFSDRLRYVTATVRRLPELRGHDVEGEFAEMFARAEYLTAMLDDQTSLDLLKDLALTEKQRAQVMVLAGGHPGLLLAVGHSLSNLRSPEGLSRDGAIENAPRPRAECMKIWNHLTPGDQESLGTLVANSGSSLPASRARALEQLGLLNGGKLFSPLFEQFVRRRTQAHQAAEHGVTLDLDSGDVWVDGVRIPVLTDLEFRLLQLLDERTGKITDKYKIVEGVWGENYLEEVDDARVEKLVSRLRSKIEADPANPAHLITLRGRGYKLISGEM